MLIRTFKALDPRYKLQYFVDQAWPADWINTVKDVTRKVYNEDYPGVDATDLPTSPKKPRAPSGDWPSLLRTTLSKKPVHQERDELAIFWASPCEPAATDPIQHWLGIAISRPESRLAQMAIDYLSAPASSIDAERAFSRGALTVTHRRHALSDTSTRNSIVLGAWLKDTTLVPKNKLVEFFQKKSSRERVTTSSSDSADGDISMDSDASS
jgi:hAT family C-terminal dimerisation region